MPRRSQVALLAILTLGACLRLYHVDRQSLWFDEAISMAIAQAPLTELPIHFTLDNSPSPRHGWNIPTYRAREVSPPVYFVALSLWLDVFGASALHARMLSLVAGVLALFVLYRIGLLLYDRATALVSTLLLAVSQLGVLYSQEARHYEMLLLLSLTTLLCYLVSTAQRSLMVWACFTLSGTLMVGTHYYGAFALLALGIHLFWHWRRRSVPIAWLAGSVIFGLIAIGPWIASTIGSQVAATMPGREYSWSAIRWTTPLSTLNRFNNGAVHDIVGTMPRWTFAVGGILFTLPVLIAAAAWLRRSTERAVEEDADRYAYSTSLCVLAVAVPVAITFSLALTGIQYDVRYVSFCIAPYYLLVATGMRRVRPITLQCALIAAAVAYSGVALRANYWSSYKENFRDAAGYVGRHAERNDCFVFVPSMKPPLGWMLYMPGPPGNRVITPAEDPASVSRCPTLWIVTYERGLEEVSMSAWDGWLTDLRNRYRRSDHRPFFWINVERFNTTPTRARQ